MSATTTTPAAAEALRVRFVIDPEASFEESNGESRPLTEAEYAESPYCACPDHPRAGTQVLDIGGDGRPQVQGCAVCQRTDYRDISYQEYRAYYGNPLAHIYVGVIVERRCPCCGIWTTVESLWHIDLMEDDKGLERVQLGQVDERVRAHYLTPEQARALPGYLSEVAGELLDEAAAAAGKEARS